MDYQIAETRLIEVLREALPDRTEMVNTSALKILEMMAGRLGLSAALSAYLEAQFHVSHLVDLPPPDAAHALEFIDRLTKSMPERSASQPPFPLNGGVVRGTCLWISGEFTLPAQDTA